jgi:formate hydrogenlyase subunit 4
VIFVVALTTHTDLPCVLGATLRGSTAEVLRPSHLLIVAAFFMLVLTDTGRDPRGEPRRDARVRADRGGARGRALGPGLAFLRWGSSVKQLVLYTIFANVLVAPCGWPPTADLITCWRRSACCSPRRSASA